MNYLFNFAHLLKWLFCPTPKPSMVGVTATFAETARDNERAWEKKPLMMSEEGHHVVDTFNSATVDVAQVPLHPSHSPVDENDIQSAPIVAPPPAVESSMTAVVEVPEAVTENTENIAAPDPTAIQLFHETMSQRPSSWITVQLQQQVTLANLAELQQELQQLLGKRVQLSGSQVQRVDTAALQLLVTFMHSAEVSVCWIDHSPALRQAARLLGLSTLLNLPE